MFEPNKLDDRKNYGEAIMPPPGYTLEKAVGTTYSLDLETLTAVCISLGLGEDIITGGNNDPLSLLRAMQRLSDKIIIFCEDGQIKFRDNLRSLVLLLEKMVVPVALPKQENSRYYPAFHPKTWLLVYKNDQGQKLYRFAVFSRNLTFDRSWDIITALDGEVNASNLDATAPIRDFIDYLATHITDVQQNATQKLHLLQELSQELGAVTFKADEPFFGFKIHPLGIGNKAYNIKKGDLFQKEFTQCVIMSPFLSSSVIADFNANERCKSYNTFACRTLITRKAELAKLDPNSADKFSVYVIKDDIYYGEETAVENEAESHQIQDIHAKIYLLDYNYEGRAYTDLYLGSMNATEAAASKNVELMIRLSSFQYSCNNFIKDIFAEIGEGNGNAFIPVSLEQDNNQIDDYYDEIEQHLKKFCREPKSANIEDLGNNVFRVEVRFTLSEPYDDIKIKPLRGGIYQRVQEKLEYELTFLDLSEFYVVNVTSRLADNTENSISRIIMIPTLNLPQGRDVAVVNDVIKNQDDFLNYMNYILGDNYISSRIEMEMANSGFYTSNEIGMDFFGSGSNISILDGPPIYEKMLKAAVYAPERIFELGKIIELLKDSGKIPEGCQEMYVSFVQALSEDEKVER